ncbi:ABC transporter ATP-binding protein [Aeromicrobium phragmitis]|uniref:ABC transporter ATP-binding protein n=1 Tax=Aeromicrobium phragmitis TaxID=2478914 RepID=A0A3L8PI40_9ACTN|nr:ABC transporter ATP-binding protein [Aeromicrobium phragmitis]RLV54996.1 ABC transporter ATP-binding protein [Aeromicrobium phragmitis]
MSPVIDVTALSKSFGPVKALDRLDLTVEPGQVAAFLGPNGAGKSTTIRILLGLLRADSGEIRVLGQDPWDDAVALHRRLAYVPGDVTLWPNLTGGEAIDVLGRLRGGVDTARRDELIERFELDPRKKARTYSKGNRQKVALVAALAADVELYILDEPTSGLDPLMEAVFQEIVGELKAAGRTILLSSHILAEVEKLCDTVTIVRAGATVQAGRLSELRHLTRSSVGVQTVDAVAPLADHPGVHDFRTRDGRAEFSLDGEHAADVMRILADARITSIVSTPPSLEELFMRYYGSVDEPETEGARS